MKLTPYEESAIRQRENLALTDRAYDEYAGGYVTEYSLAGSLQISPSAAAEVAVYAARVGIDANNDPHAAFTAWADAAR